ncbi:hypothetical protein SAMN05421810_103343 [Amycolatopsis arida]|uniref:DUF5937 domain-containing protein n=1 Tax=Amycolatopsis arida TaxID=587909 RepID=A0A1I5T0C5_9PSEU|nr:DUF5937 family protein [Amycolatopsis arida]TDX96278.1 hypothetical protein CLV69_103415 [Amycolatopsis arida]SFP76480.1 hypothetical protein SAMN05421810_103343 [Amycolatopsis arida]
MIELVLTAAGAQRVRFAVSPLEEALGAVRVALGVRDHPTHLPWLADHAGHTVHDLEIPELASVLGAPRYITDFLSPPPEGPRTTAEAQFAAIRHTPPDQVAAELALVDADLGPLPDDPARARDLLADQLELAWTTLVAPHWPRIHQVLLADIEHRSTRLAEGGLRAALAGIHPRVRPGERAVLVDIAARERVELDERGLLLLPSVFAWPQLGVITMPPWQPALVYPARGAAAVWEYDRPAPAALAAVVGRTKAALLAALVRPSRRPRPSWPTGWGSRPARCRSTSPRCARRDC